MKTPKNTYFNIIFPTWLIWIIPISWLVIIPGNIIIDALVIYLSLRYLKISERKTKLKQTLFKAVLFGFLSDFLGMIFLVVFNIITSYMVLSKPLDKIIDYVHYNPLRHPVSLIIVGIGILIAGFFIYYLNRNFNFNKLNLPAREEKLLSLYMAIFTAPYLFLLPMEWFF